MMTKQEIADYLKLSVPTIERLVRIGMPNYKIDKGSIRFELEEVKDWIKNNSNR